MRFKSVLLQNFMSYKDQPFCLEDTGLTLIEGKNLDEGGSNGAGKSSAWDALSWAIFGKTVRGLKGDEVIHRKLKKNCFVQVDVEHNGHLMKVRRYRKHDKFGDRFMIYGPTDVLIAEKGTIALTEEWLLDQLQIDFELFRCTILFAQGETFNFVDAGDKAQKEILSKVMRLELSAYQDRAKARIKTAEAEKSELERKIAVLESHEVSDPADLFKADSDEWVGQHKDRLVKLAGEIEVYGKRLADAQAYLDKLFGLSEDREKLKAMYSKVAERMGEMHSQSSVLASKIEAADAQAKKWKSLDGDCPTCEEPISKDKIDKCYAEVVKQRAELISAKDMIPMQLAPWKKKAAAIQEKLDALDDKVMDRKAYEGQVVSYGDRIAEFKAELAEAKKETNPFKDKAEEEAKRQLKIRTSLKEYRDDLKAINLKLPYLQFWVIGFGDSGIKSFVFDLVCGTLTNRANKYLNVLTSGSVSISFDTQKKLKSGDFREKFDCTVSSGGEQVTYAAYSGGEKRRISLAVDLALSDLMGDYYAAGFNLVVFDEQMSFLDKSGRENFMKLLRMMAKTKRVFVVDHDSEFKSKFDDVWTIEKHNEVSRLI